MKRFLDREGEKLKKKYTAIFLILLFIAAIALLVLFLRSNNIAVLDPKGMIAEKERDLIVTATLLMLIVVVPVFLLTFFIAWKYRASNTKAKYTPDRDFHMGLEFTWWFIPCVIVLILGIKAWNTSHELDPFRPLDAAAKPIHIQVVALNWKWLFIYPEQGIASVNLVQFPHEIPINFEITADAPMNSFWIPQLGGQIYAMPGMRSKLHLIANEEGLFNGSSANLSGEGFAGMRFVAKACCRADFDEWVQSIKQASEDLNMAKYHQLAEPSVNHAVATYVLMQEDLFDEVVMKYRVPME